MRKSIKISLPSSSKNSIIKLLIMFVAKNPSPRPHLSISECVKRQLREKINWKSTEKVLKRNFNRAMERNSCWRPRKAVFKSYTRWNANLIHFECVAGSFKRRLCRELQICIEWQVSCDWQVIDLTTFALLLKFSSWFENNQARHWKLHSEICVRAVLTGIFVTFFSYFCGVLSHWVIKYKFDNFFHNLMRFKFCGWWGHWRCYMLLMSFLFLNKKLSENVVKIHFYVFFFIKV